MTHSTPGSEPSPFAATLRRAAYRVSVVMVGANLALTVVNLWRYPGVYRPGWGWGAAALFAGAISWAAREATRAQPRRIALAVTVGTAYVITLAHPLLLAPGTASRYLPLLHVAGAAMHVTAVVTGARAALGLVLGYAVAVASLRAPLIGTVEAWREAGLLALSGLIATATVHILDLATRRVADAVADHWRAQEQAARARRRAVEEVRWDALVHDKVLAALLAAGRAPRGAVPPAAQSLAGEALEAVATLRPGSGPDASVQDRVRAIADRLGLIALVRLRGELLDRDVSDALVDATGEALTNVQRHAGVEQVRVEGSLGSRHASVTITDQGVGFEQTRSGRAGLQTVAARMRSIGGSAVVTSRPGAGTQVALTWDAHVAPRALSRSDWSLRAFAPLMSLGAIALAMNVWLGAVHWSAAPDRLAAVVVILMIVLVTVASALLPPHSPTFPVVLAAIALTPPCAAVVQAAGTAAPAMPWDWRYWYLGAITPAVGAVAFRRRRYAGLLAGGSAGVLVAFVDQLLGYPWWSCLVGPMPVLVVTAVTGHVLRLSLDRIWDRVAATTRATAELRIATAEDDERRAAAGRRVQELRALTLGTVHRIADGSPLSAAEQADLLLVEAGVRDGLVAPGLLDPPLQAALRAARARGADVVVDGPGAGTQRAAYQGLAALRLAAQQVLGTADSGSQVRIQWGPPPATVTYVGTAAPRVLERVRAIADRVDGAPVLRVSGDAVSVFVEAD